MACLRYGRAACAHKPHNHTPRVLLTHSAAVPFPQVQDEFCQLWQKTAAAKCSPEPVPFTRTHLLLWHEPACVEKPTCAIAVLGSRAGRGSRPTSRAVVAGSWFHGPGEFSGADSLDCVHGEKMDQGSEGQDIPLPLPAPSLASPSVPSIFLGYLLCLLIKGTSLSLAAELGFAGLDAEVVSPCVCPCPGVQV